MASRTTITITGKATPNFLKDTLSNPKMNVFMDDILDRLANRGWQVVETEGHSSYCANAEEVRSWGNSWLRYRLTNNLDNFITYSEDSHFELMNRGKLQIDDYHFDHKEILGRSLRVEQVHRSNGTDEDVSIRIRVVETALEVGDYDHDYHCEKMESKYIADEKFSFGMGERAIETRFARLGI